jgi:hypothetical protein
MLCFQRSVTLARVMGLGMHKTSSSSNRASHRPRYEATFETSSNLLIAEVSYAK